MLDNDVRRYIRGSSIIKSQEDEDNISKLIQEIKDTMCRRGIEFDSWDKEFIDSSSIIYHHIRPIYLSIIFRNVR